MLKTIDVTVQGETFTLTEPNALSLCDYWEAVTKLSETVNDDSSDMMKGKVNIVNGLQLVAICLMPHFPEKSKVYIYDELCSSLVDYNDIRMFVDAAEDVAGLKMNTTDMQGGNSDTD